MAEGKLDWLPEELREDLLTPRGNRLLEMLGTGPRYSKSVASSRYCWILLENNRAASNIWKDVVEAGISPLDVYWACESTFEQAAKFKTKKMPPSELTQLELEIRKTAADLRRLIQGTPVDEVIRLSGWLSEDCRELDIGFSELLDRVSTSDFSDYADPQEYSRPSKKPGAKKAIRTEMILRLHEVLIELGHNKRNRLIADIVSLVIDDATSDETVKDVLKNRP